MPRIYHKLKVCKNLSETDQQKTQKIYFRDKLNRVTQFVLISDLKKMIVLLQTSVVYLILCTYPQIVGTNHFQI